MWDEECKICSCHAVKAARASSLEMGEEGKIWSKGHFKVWMTETADGSSFGKTDFKPSQLTTEAADGSSFGKTDFKPSQLTTEAADGSSCHVVKAARPSSLGIQDVRDSPVAGKSHSKGHFKPVELVPEIDEESIAAVLRVFLTSSGVS